MADEEFYEGDNPDHVEEDPEKEEVEGINKALTEQKLDIWSQGKKRRIQKDQTEDVASSDEDLDITDVVIMKTICGNCLRSCEKKLK